MRIHLLGFAFFARSVECFQPQTSHRRDMRLEASLKPVLASLAGLALAGQVAVASPLPVVGTLSDCPLFRRCHLTFMANVTVKISLFFRFDSLCCSGESCCAAGGRILHPFYLCFLRDYGLLDALLRGRRQIFCY